MSATIEFQDFGKTPRFRTLQALITEKIDGTNAQIYVPADPAEPVLAGSRNRWATPEKDNAGFARFVYENADMFRRLGPGRHFGEWYGSKVGRGYGMTERRLALFNVDRFSGGLPEGLPACVELVPVLYRGPLDTAKIAEVTEALYVNGSVAVPGWKHPEGVVITCAGLRWKITDNGDEHKGATVTHREIVQAEAAKRRAERDASMSTVDRAMREVKVRKVDGLEGSFDVYGQTADGILHTFTCEAEEIPAKRTELATLIAQSHIDAQNIEVLS